MAKTPKLTPETLKVLNAFLEDPELERYGYELMKATGLKSGTLYPILLRLEDAGWIESDWAATEESDTGRPRRRYYQITSSGQKEAVDAFREYERELASLKQLRPGWKGA